MLEQRQLYIGCLHSFTLSCHFAFLRGTNSMQLTDRAVKFIFQNGISVSIHLSVRFMARFNSFRVSPSLSKTLTEQLSGRKATTGPRRSRTICGVERNKMRKTTISSDLPSETSAVTTSALPARKINAAAFGSADKSAQCPPSHGATIQCAPPNPLWAREFQQHAAPR